eukprot:GFYU01008178.1.p1 GENE.GFYU01008178.1~~GFYU01008178.1.p1  ORF type:complete len:122 (+),score=9.58 GFYU01008178.1:606-971(+)
MFCSSTRDHREAQMQARSSTYVCTRPHNDFHQHAMPLGGVGIPPVHSAALWLRRCVPPHHHTTHAYNQNTYVLAGCSSVVALVGRWQCGLTPSFYFLSYRNQVNTINRYTLPELPVRDSIN